MERMGARHWDGVELEHHGRFDLTAENRGYFYYRSRATGLRFQEERHVVEGGDRGWMARMLWADNSSQESGVPAVGARFSEGAVIARDLEKGTFEVELTGDVTEGYKISAGFLSTATAVSVSKLGAWAVFRVDGDKGKDQ